MGTTPGRLRRALHGIRHWFGRQRNELLRDGLLVALGIVAALWIASRQDQLARDLQTASEIQENTRFVRQVVIDNATSKPFRGLNLSGASLSGLDLRCESLSKGTGCADLFDANLTGANLTFADLTGADLSFSDLTSANLANANLNGAFLVGANLTDAFLFATDLTGATLGSATLAGATLAGVCYDETTTWPDGFTPPSPKCP